MSDNYCKKCGEKIRSKIKMKGDVEQTLCGLCMDDELNAKKKLTWTERIEMISIHPEAATVADVYKMAGELMECRKVIIDLRSKISEAVASLITVK